MRWFLLGLIVVGTPLAADEVSDRTASIVTEHVLPRFDALATDTEALHKVALHDCDITSAQLRTAYGEAFDAWISASHLRMGPTEVEDRAFALAFWPDPRGKTAKSLRQLISEQDASVYDATAFSNVSIAARGLYALDYLLYDHSLGQNDKAEYTCALVQAITLGIAENSAAIAKDWQEEFAEYVTSPTAIGPYRNDMEALQALVKSLATGLQVTSDMRLGRPMGEIDRPRPKRAEAWRSGRSHRHVELSLNALKDLASYLTDGTTVEGSFDDGFARAEAQLARTDDPVFALVSDPSGRFQMDILKLELDYLRDEPMTVLQEDLGVTSGFNALDGD